MSLSKKSNKYIYIFIYNMTNNELKDAMTSLYFEFSKSNDIKKTIAAAVALGMKFREEEIRDGIDIVFKTIHTKNDKMN